MIATMDRVPFTQLFQNNNCITKPTAIRSLPLQSPTIAAEPYPTSYHHHHLQGPTDNMPYAVQAATSTPAARPNASSSSCHQSSPPPPPYHHNDMMDPRESLYLSTSVEQSMMSAAASGSIVSSCNNHLSLLQPAASTSYNAAMELPKPSSPIVAGMTPTTLSQSGQ